MLTKIQNVEIGWELIKGPGTLFHGVFSIGKIDSKIFARVRERSEIQQKDLIWVVLARVGSKNNQHPCVYGVFWGRINNYAVHKYGVFAP